MAKQKITDAIQKKFDKPQFQPGAAVFFSWMGQKQCGYVTKFKNVGWGIQYTVQSVEKTNYPCGMEIQNQKTSYSVGYILYETTKSIGQDELERRIETERNQPKSRPINAISIITGGSATKITADSREGGSDSTSVVVEDTKTRSNRVSTKVDTKSSAARNTAGNTRKRKVAATTELDVAIQKQRAFLNGFVKKD